jgi:hypothetical protein
VEGSNLGDCNGIGCWVEELEFRNGEGRGVDVGLRFAGVGDVDAVGVRE